VARVEVFVVGAISSLFPLSLALVAGAHIPSLLSELPQILIKCLAPP
jgi:hypothetical protein